jgi:hypothetical protein
LTLEERKKNNFLTADVLDSALPANGRTALPVIEEGLKEPPFFTIERHIVDNMAKSGRTGQPNGDTILSGEASFRCKQHVVGENSCRADTEDHVLA